MKLTLFALILALVFTTFAIDGHTGVHTDSVSSPVSMKPSCPPGSERARSIVKNFLANPDLSEERSETGTSSLGPEQIQLVQSEDTCQQLDSEYSQYSGYTSTYYKAGGRYFVTLLLEQPDDPQKVVSGISIIVVLNSNLEKIESYGG